MISVKPKKKLGQHFLRDKNIALKVADLIDNHIYCNILEIGPGTGVLTEFLMNKAKDKLVMVDIDTESVEYLRQKYGFGDELWSTDFLKEAKNILDSMQGPWFVVGNFPYNISSQILFKILENRERVDGFGGMFQREVARRICSAPNSKEYGILSVLLQAYYKLEYCFTVSEGVFDPPPKVKTGVMKGVKYRNSLEVCSDKLFLDVVKTSFNQRRKTLSNSLRKFNLNKEAFVKTRFANLRPENLSVEDFVELTQLIENESK